MSQADIGAFIESVRFGTTTPTCVTAAVVARGIPVSERHNNWLSETALHRAVRYKRRELLVALSAAGADPNVKDADGWTSAWAAAYYSTADILQLLIKSGGNMNEPNDYGETPLNALVKDAYGDAAARLKVLLACPQLALDAKYLGITAEQWAMHTGRSELAQAIAQERRRRMRWSASRFTWIATTNFGACGSLRRFRN